VCHVGQCRDSPVGKDVHRSVMTAHHGGAEVDLFYQSSRASDDGDIANADLVHEKKQDS